VSRGALAQRPAASRGRDIAASAGTSCALGRAGSSARPHRGAPGPEDELRPAGTAAPSGRGRSGDRCAHRSVLVREAFPGHRAGPAHTEPGCGGPRIGCTDALVTDTEQDLGAEMDTPLALPLAVSERNQRQQPDPDVLAGLQATAGVLGEHFGVRASALPVTAHTAAELIAEYLTRSIGEAGDGPVVLDLRGLSFMGS
jgi:hypothetical protein